MWGEFCEIYKLNNDFSNNSDLIKNNKKEKNIKIPNGINVLEKTEIYQCYSSYQKLILAFMFITIFALIGYVIIEKYQLLIICIISAIILVMLLIFSNFFVMNTGKYQYKVIINKNVSFVEVYNKYNIIKYDSKNNIYTIEDK